MPRFLNLLRKQALGRHSFSLWLGGLVAVSCCWNCPLLSADEGKVGVLLLPPENTKSYSLGII